MDLYHNIYISATVEKAKEIASPTNPFPITPNLVFLIFIFYFIPRLRQLNHNSFFNNLDIHFMLQK